jgi:hypothetical protein
MIILQKSITTTVEKWSPIIACDYNSFINIESKVTVKMPLLTLNALCLSITEVQIRLKGENINLRTSSPPPKYEFEYQIIECKASSGSSITIEGTC